MHAPHVRMQSSCCQPRMHACMHACGVWLQTPLLVAAHHIHAPPPPPTHTHTRQPSGRCCSSWRCCSTQPRTQPHLGHLLIPAAAVDAPVEGAGHGQRAHHAAHKRACGHATHASNTPGSAGGGGLDAEAAPGHHRDCHAAVCCCVRARQGVVVAVSCRGCVRAIGRHFQRWSRVLGVFGGPPSGCWPYVPRKRATEEGSRV
jgi:hypothetical protein